MAMPRNLLEILSLPTAPFAEHAVLDHLRQACGRIPHVRLSQDRCGNLLAHYRHEPDDATPLVFTAHTDHPGFVALDMTSRNRLRAAFRGWVEPEYFLGTSVRFWTPSGAVRGRVAELTATKPLANVPGRAAQVDEAVINVDGEVPAGCPGMWDLPEPELRDGKVFARGCDDMTGCAAMLELLERLSGVWSERPAPPAARGEVYCLFTRAEEVGFVGAIGAARDGTIPRDLPIIAIENSKELPSARQGDGPILRVGDKSAVFTPELTHFCWQVGQLLVQARPDLRLQRKLMDGGTCESTVYWAYGYQATGLCVALGNYHNMNVATRQIESEYISLADWTAMVDWFEALVRARPGYGRELANLRAGMDQRFEKWSRLL